MQQTNSKTKGEADANTTAANTTSKGNDNSNGKNSHGSNDFDITDAAPQAEDATMNTQSDQLHDALS